MVTSSTNKARTTGYELSFETVELYDEGTAGFFANRGSKLGSGHSAKAGVVEANSYA